MIFYTVANGEICIEDEFLGTGYSGSMNCRNNPVCEVIPQHGPIPRGHYIMSEPYRHTRLGPIVFDLEPEPGTDVFGRKFFRIHGDNKTHDASHGCIILGPSIRAAIAMSKQRELFVL